MKITNSNLEQTLKQGLVPCYLISTDEILLQQEAKEKIINTAKSQGYIPTERYSTNQHFKWQEVFTNTNNLSLFAQKEIIEIHIPTGKPGKPGSEIISEYCQNLDNHSNLIFIFTTPKLDSSSQRSRWVKAITEQGHWLPIWPLSEQQFPSWLQTRLRQKNLKLDKDALSHLIQLSFGNLLAANQEIEKLALIYQTDKPKTLDINHIKAACADNSHYDIYQAVDSALAGKPKQTQQILKRLQGEGIAPSLVLWAMHRELTTLYRLAELIQQGDSSQSAIDKQKIWQKRQAITKQALSRHSINQLAKLIINCANIDKSIKGVHTTSPWDSLQRLYQRVTD